jgi:hypothetical protein
MFRSTIIEKFHVHPFFYGFRLKIMHQCGNFPLDSDIVDIVDLEEFGAIEEDRIPLFYGTIQGLYPKPEKIPNLLGKDRYFAVVGYSVYNGPVEQLGIYQIRASDEELCLRPLDKIT